MSIQDVTKIKDKDVLGSIVAMKRAAEYARQVAIQTGTSIVVMKDQKLVHVTAEQLLQERQSSSR